MRESSGKLLSILALGWGLAWAARSSAETLPVFRLVEPRIDTAQASRLLGSLNEGQVPRDARPVDRADAVGQRAGNKVAEVQRASGGIFLADLDRLWKPGQRPTLPSRPEAKDTADQFLRSNQLLPTQDARVRVSFDSFSETGVAADGARAEKTILDVQTNYRTELRIRRGGRETWVPVVGGGGKFKVAVGQGKQVIGFHGVWRGIAGVAGEEQILPKAEAEARFKRQTAGLKITRMDSFLGYYAAPAFEKQTHLAPVWVVRAQAEVGGQKVPLRNTIVAATRYGPAFPQIPARPRGPGAKPPRRSLDKDEPGRPQRSSRLDPLDLLADLFSPREALAQDGNFEAGTSWIGPSQGLGGSPANAKGFVDGLAAAGWSINFNWGELKAFESDWRANDDSWADAADFVFYTGHANSDGWVLNKPDDSFLHFGEVGVTPGSPNDHYGANDLEWIIIAACGPHQSNHFVGGVGNAFDRWRGIFDGLHVFLGYGAVTYDNTTEGMRTVQLARAGWPIIDAWFRAAWEIQPSTNGFAAPNGPTIWVTAMYAHMGDHATRNDHIWGTGTTVNDPVGPGQQRQLLWSGT